MLLKTIIEVNKIFLLYKEKGQVMETDLPKIHKPDQELMAERQTYTVEEAANSRNLPCGCVPEGRLADDQDRREAAGSQTRTRADARRDSVRDRHV
jgi:hypothetical protein